MYHPAFLAAFPDFPDRVARLRAKPQTPGPGGEADLVRQPLLNLGGGLEATSGDAAAASAIPAAPQAPAPSKALSHKSSSKFIGVSKSVKDDRRKVFKAVVTHDRKQRFLGYFHTEEEAALAYDKASVKLRGPFARVNFPSSLAGFMENHPAFTSNPPKDDHEQVKSNQESKRHRKESESEFSVASNGSNSPNEA